MGAANLGVASDDVTPILQTFQLSNPSAALDIFHITQCTNGQDPFNESIAPNAGAVFGCGSFAEAAGNVTSFYNGPTGPDGLPDGFADLIRKYQAFEFQVEQRFSKNWQLLANWRWRNPHSPAAARAGA